MRRVGPWVAGAVVLVALWPVLCVSSEDGPTNCRSVLVALPWGEGADSWGMVVAAAAAVLAFVVVRRLLGSGSRKA
ncbi:hypothetical protein NOK12_36880 [Nocardioides sp. OK12]|uniref:hypothetical protein n=1 Tax=Nocardioides sp. OK12 TaxID=2758661 RepID=UPI0021C30474|nr:hypothetical protein [Nocardioides sp. OK12]GHJ61170.1 hypothetical protein NOK12_36880 [Nocardioides sp. OK12]